MTLASFTEDQAIEEVGRAASFAAACRRLLAQDGDYTKPLAPRRTARRRSGPAAAPP